MSPGAESGHRAVHRVAQRLLARIVLQERDRRDSEIVPGTPHSAFRLLYRFRDEELSEIRNAVVQRYVCFALTRVQASYRLYWAVYVLPVSRLTRPYLIVIEPLRRFILYPVMLRRIRRAWLGAYATPAAGRRRQTPR